MPSPSRIQFRCPACDTINLLTREKCWSCGHVFTEAERDPKKVPSVGIRQPTDGAAQTRRANKER